MASSARIASLTLDQTSLMARTPEAEHERAVAIADLLEENHFEVAGASGPYAVKLAVVEGRLRLGVMPETGETVTLEVRVAPLRGTIRDYFIVCDSYFEAIKQADPRKIEAIDMGRRGLHNEGAEKLAELLEGKVTLDHLTARRLFTLICVLHIR